MRPARRLLVLAAAATVLSVLILAAPAAAPMAAVAPWPVLALAALGDLAALARTGRPGVAIDPPGDVYCGETAALPVRLSAPGGGRLPPIRGARAEVSPALGGVVAFGAGPVAEGGAMGELRLPARQRGRHRITAIWLLWDSPLGLWEATPRVAVDVTLRVVPNIRPVTSGRIDTTVRAHLYGQKDTMTRGEGSEFHQLIEFTTGMDSRAIDWKHSARHRTLVAKEMRAERNHQIVLALDTGYLMRAEVAGLARIDHAINAALTVAWAAGLGGDLVGLYSFDAQPGRWTPPQPARAGFQALRAQMAELAYATHESNHTLALAHLNGLLRRRALIVIFTDFADTTTAELLVENLEVLNRAHVILFVTLRDPDLAARLDGAARAPAEVAEAVVAAEIARERQLVLDRLAGLGILCVEAAPGELTPRLLSAYLEIKARELI